MHCACSHQTSWSKTAGMAHHFQDVVDEKIPELLALGSYSLRSHRSCNAHFHSAGNRSNHFGRVAASMAAEGETSSCSSSCS